MSKSLCVGEPHDIFLTYPPAPRSNLFFFDLFTENLLAGGFKFDETSGLDGIKLLSENTVVIRIGAEHFPPAE